MFIYSFNLTMLLGMAFDGFFLGLFLKLLFLCIPKCTNQTALWGLMSGYLRQRLVLFKLVYRAPHYTQTIWTLIFWLANLKASLLLDSACESLTFHIYKVNIFKLFIMHLLCLPESVDLIIFSGSKCVPSSTRDINYLLMEKSLY